MKKSIVLAALAASAVANVAYGAAVCASPSAAGDGTQIVSSDTSFVKVSFTPKCSANVYMNATQTPTAMGVVSGSSKGKNYFGGSTNGGSVKPNGTCPSTGCTTSEVSDAASAALAS